LSYAANFVSGGTFGCPFEETLAGQVTGTSVNFTLQGASTGDCAVCGVTGSGSTVSQFTGTIVGDDLIIGTMITQSGFSGAQCSGDCTGSGQSSADLTVEIHVSTPSSPVVP
jgi:hypothetical protein